MHLLLKPHIFFYSNGVAILSGFHDIPQNILIGYTDVINLVKVQKPEKTQLGTLEIMYTFAIILQISKTTGPITVLLPI